MKIIFLKSICIFVFAVVIFSLFSSVVLSATIVVPVVGLPRYGWQTADTSLEVCDGSTSSIFLNYMYSDFYYLKQMNFPPAQDVTSLDYCIKGRGNISVGTYTDHRQEFVGNGLEQCFNSVVSPYYKDLILANSSDAVFGGAVNSSSSVDCLYVKINYTEPEPTPTITPIPTIMPTEEPTPTMEITPIPLSAGQACLSPTGEPLLTPTLIPTIIETAAPTPTTVVCVPTLPPVVCPSSNPITPSECFVPSVLGAAIGPSSEPSPTTVVKAGLVKKTQPVSKNNFLKYIFPIALLTLLVFLVFKRWSSLNRESTFV